MVVHGLHLLQLQFCGHKCCYSKPYSYQYIELTLQISGTTTSTTATTTTVTPTSSGGGGGGGSTTPAVDPNDTDGDGIANALDASQMILMSGKMPMEMALAIMEIPMMIMTVFTML